MSALSTPLLRHFFALATQNPARETFFSFWQTFLRSEFPTDTWATICNIPPEQTPKRDSITLSRYYHDSHTVVPQLWVECKVQDDYLDGVERRAAESAGELVQMYDLPLLFVITTTGVAFRLWVYERDSPQLVPLHGTRAAEGDLGQYVSVDSEKAHILGPFMGLVKLGGFADAGEARERLMRCLVAQTNGNHR